MAPSKCIILAFTLGDSAVSDYYQALAEELIERDFKIIIITPHRKVDMVSPETNPAIFTWPSDRPTKFKDAKFLINLIRQYRPVIIYSTFVATNICTIVSWLMHVPLRFTAFHTGENKYLQGKEFIKQKLFRIRKIAVLSLATKVLPVSNGVAKEVETIYKVPKQKIYVSQNALKDPGLYKQLGSWDKFDLVCVAGLTYGKGHDVLIKALPIVANNYPQFKLFLAGEGNNKNTLNKKVEDLDLSDKVVFLGQIPHQQAISLMSKAYAFILPTRFDAFPFAIIEAMSVGTPSIASNVGGIPELIRDGIDGFLVPVEDHRLLAEKIMNLLGNPTLRDSMGANARERYLEYFELDKAIVNQADWFERQIENVTM